MRRYYAPILLAVTLATLAAGTLVDATHATIAH